MRELQLTQAAADLLHHGGAAALRAAVSRGKQAVGRWPAAMRLQLTQPAADFDITLVLPCFVLL